MSIEGQGATVGHVMTGGQVTSGGRVSIEGQGATVGRDDGWASNFWGTSVNR